MVGKLISVVGVFLATGGTVWSLWDIIAKTDKELVKEASRHFSAGHKVKTAKEQRNHTIYGMVCIGIGAVLQVVGLFLI